MEIERNISTNRLTLVLNGRFDAEWSGSVDAAIAAAVRDGHHQVLLDLGGVDYISSAGLRVLLSHLKQLKAVNGSFSITNVRPNVRKVLELSGLTMLFDSTPSSSPAALESRKFETANARWEQHGAIAAVKLRTVGRPSPFECSAGESISFSTNRIGLGIGSLASTATEAAPRLGEFLAVAGCAAHLPGVYSGRADFVVRQQDLLPEAWLTSALVAEGSPELLLRFESDARIGLFEILQTAVEAVHGPAMFVLLAEAAGLVGASLRRSPAEASDDPFGFPAIRDWLNFTSEREHRDSVALVVGLAAQPGDSREEWLRPVGRHGEILCHAHAAVFPYRPIQKGAIAMASSVEALFEAGGLRTVLHLIHDIREPDGAGESEFFRGACWAAAIES